MNKIVIATHNKGKLKEFSRLFDGIYEVFSAQECGFCEQPEENGQSFYENALIKARAVSLAVGTDALADDSGLCVEALGGAPGIFSARYAGENADDADNNNKLLQTMRFETNRNAKFVCSLALYFADGEILRADGETRGEILRAPKGSGGFGYDCLFYSPELGKTFAEADERDKNAVSHRARASRQLLKLLDERKNPIDR